MMLITILALLLFPAVASSEEHRITRDEGGILSRYVHHYERLKHEGHTVVLDGPCFSACTVALILPREQLCFTNRAVLYFHAAYVERRFLFWSWREIQPRETEYLMSLYPRPVRAWIIAMGGLGKDHIVMRSDQLAKYVRKCG